jgi:HD domain
LRAATHSGAADSPILHRKAYLVTLASVSHDEQAARSLAERLLSADLPRRWSHVAGVAHRAKEVSARLDIDTDLLVSAAWLHDVGYAPAVIETGFHPLDGGRYVRNVGFPSRVASLVAHHSNALEEAEVRGLAVELIREFPREESKTSDALWFCDMTTGPDGQHLTVEERLHEIRNRYGPADAVTRFVDRAQDTLVAAVRRTETELRSAHAQR